MKLEQNIVQVQTLSTQTIQSLKILQMNTPELMDYVQEISMENPVLEAEFSAVSAAGAAGRGQSQMGWLENSDPQQHWQKQQGNEPDARDYAAETQAESLKDYVRSQLPAQSGKLAQALSYLTECLDENGWLLASLEVLAAESGLSLALLERALSQIQNVEPWALVHVI